MVRQCPVCSNFMYEDISSDGIFLRCSVNGCNTKMINFPHITKEEIIAGKKPEKKTLNNKKARIYYKR